MSWAPLHPLKDLCEISHGSTPSKSEARYWGGTLPWVSPKDMRSDTLSDTEDHLTSAASAEARAPIAPPGSIFIVVRSGILVRKLPVALAMRAMSFNQDIKTLVPDTTKIHPKYALRFLQSREREVLVSGVKKGATVHSVISGYIEGLRVPVPSTSEQDRIVELLDEADTLRGQRTEADAKLALLLPALFRHHFGDPARNPRRFPTKSIRSLAAKYSDGPFGSNLKSDHYASSGVRVIRLQNIGVGQLLDGDKAYIPDVHFASLAKHECLPGDVLIGTMGDPNLRACIQPSWLSCALNKADCVQFRPDLSQCTAEYICWLLNDPSTLAMAGSLVVGQTRARISMGRLGELEVPAPPLAKQQEFSRQVELASPLTEHAAASGAKLESLFQALLHRAFTGELTSEWREAHLREGVQEMTQLSRA
ncbi:MAG TPA: restriction endonuclease subunit S [Opitutaceae bacterium]|nr:restriction endonuclease subunit S [Opitutaceae bacterium]